MSVSTLSLRHVIVLSLIISDFGKVPNDILLKPRHCFSHIAAIVGTHAFSIFEK